MDVANDIIVFSKKVLENASKIDDVIDSALEPLKDYTDTAEDVIGPIKSIVALYNLKKKLAFRSFLKNYAIELEKGYIIDEDEKQKLENFFKSKKNVQYIAEVIDGAIESKSTKASAILGVIAGRIIKDKTEISINEIYVIESLKQMTDIDLFNFIALIDYSRTYIDENNIGEFRVHSFFNSENNVPPVFDKESVEISIEKLKRTNGLSYGSGGIGSFGNAKGAFKITSVTEALYSLVKETQIFE